MITLEQAILMLESWGMLYLNWIFTFRHSSAMCLISIFWTGLISWGPSFPSMIVSLHMTCQSNWILGHIEESIQNRYLLRYLLLVITTWLLYLMSSMSSAPEVQGECSAQCIQSPYLRYKKGAPPLLQWNSKITLMSNAHCFQSQKERSHLLSSAPRALPRHWNQPPVQGILWFWKTKLLDGTSSCNVGA